jgi:hypothetical protein
VFQIHALPLAAALEPPLAPGILDENAPHGLGRRGEKVPAPSKEGCSPPVSRSHASWTKAVGWSV